MGTTPQLSRTLATESHNMDNELDLGGGMNHVENASFTVPEKNIDGRKLNRKSVGGDKLISADTNSVSTASIQNNAVTQAKLASASVGQGQLRYETATLAFASGDTSKTASVTSGSIVIGVYSSVVTSTPAYGELQLGISGTTLTGTRSASPGGAAAITYVVTLLKT